MAQSSKTLGPLPSFDGLDNYIEKARQDWQGPRTAIVITKNDSITYAKRFAVREIDQPGRVDADRIRAIGLTIG